VSEVSAEARTVPKMATELENGPLEERSPGESCFEKIYPFGSDLELREEYINFFGGLRIGKLLEDLDLVAGKVAYSHTQGWERGLGIVTAACDRIDLTGALPSTSDLQLLVSVNWVGRSSLEVGIRISSGNENNWRRVARAFFIMVARREGLAAAVNPLSPKSPEELRRFKEGQERQRLRREMSRHNIMTVAPNEQESELLHSLFLRIRQGKLKGASMAETLRQSTRLMHPQFRNIHNKIFGGYLMREAFELAWNITYLYCREWPQFLCVDHMYFFEPVEIGSILSFTGQVIYTSPKALMVEVTIEVIDPVSGTSEVTNVSFYTFTALDEAGEILEITPVLPNTYEEGLKYLDGSKRFRLGEKSREYSSGRKNSSKSG